MARLRSRHAFRASRCRCFGCIGNRSRLQDVGCVMYLRNYLMHLQRAVADGVPVRGYFLWSFLDNYEWSDGYRRRFGIHSVDFKTEKRTSKLSAEFYREVTARKAVV
ncbi:MAG: family 1 glycosylhydrolase [Acidobacteriaceae bacterium]